MKISELKQLVREAVEEVSAELGSKPYIIEGKYMWVRDDVAEKIMALPTTKFSTGSGAKNFRDDDYAYFMETVFQYRGNTSKYKAEIALRKYTAKPRYPGYSFVIAAISGDFGFGFTWMLTKHIFSARLHKVMFDAAAKFIDEKVKPDTLKEEGGKKDIGGLRQHVMSRLSKLPKYKGNQAALNAAVNKIVSLAQCGDPRVCEMWTAWEGKMNEASSGQGTITASIPNEDIQAVTEIAQRYQLKDEVDATTGQIVFTGEQGQLDAFVSHVLDAGYEVDFDREISATGMLKENASKSHQTLKWQDGVELGLDSGGRPIDMKNLGYLNSGIQLPKADDWRRFFVSSTGNLEKYFSPSLKVWYSVDSS